MILNLRLLFLLIIGILAIFPLYSNDSEENDNIEPPKSDIKINNNLENDWDLLYFINLGYSYPRFSNFMIGLDLTMANVVKKPFFTLHTFGLEYQYLYSQSVIRINYTYARYILAFGGSIGVSSFYNINNNDIGIAPIIGLNALVPSIYLSLISLTFKLNYYYRYNFVINNMNNSYHENVFSVGVIIQKNN